MASICFIVSTNVFLIVIYLVLSFRSFFALSLSLSVDVSLRFVLLRFWLMWLLFLLRVVKVVVIAVLILHAAAAAAAA